MATTADGEAATAALETAGDGMQEDDRRSFASNASGVSGASRSEGRGEATEEDLEGVPVWNVVSIDGAVLTDGQSGGEEGGGGGNVRVVARLPFGTLLRARKCADPKFLQVLYPYKGWVRRCKNNGWIEVARGDAMTSAIWRYRVVHHEGAIVRSGVELRTGRVGVKPYGSIIEAVARCYDSIGVPRLRVNTGWISERLNPLSGQSGPIVELLPMVQPLIYRVVLEEGCVVRGGVELLSRTLGQLQCGAEVQVVEKRWSDNPKSFCVPRLRVRDDSDAGANAWISLRVNRLPPDNIPVVQPIAPVPEDVLPAAATLQCAPHTDVGKLEQIRDASRAADDGSQGSLDESLACVVCMEQPRTATIVHGDTGHIACCINCARALHGRGDACPCCRQPIDAVLQHYWA